MSDEACSKRKMARFWAVCVALTKEPAMVAATAMELLWMEMGVPAVMKADSTAPSLAAAVLFAAIVFSSHRVRPQPSSRSQLSFCISTVLAHSIQNNMARGRHGRAWLQAQRLRDTVPTVFDDAALLSTIATARASVSHRGIYDTDDTFDDHLRGQLASNDAFSFPANTSNIVTTFGEGCDCPWTAGAVQRICCSHDQKRYNRQALTERDRQSTQHETRANNNTVLYGHRRESTR